MFSKPLLGMSVPLTSLCAGSGGGNITLRSEATLEALPQSQLVLCIMNILIFSSFAFNLPRFLLDRCLGINKHCIVLFSYTVALCARAMLIALLFVLFNCRGYQGLF